MTTQTLPSLPSEEESLEASAALDVLLQVVGTQTLQQVELIGPSSQRVSVPQPAFELLIQILEQMAKGNAITVVPYNAELTTQQAAEVLNVSRPFVVKLIEQGELSARHVGNRRRIRFEDLLAYKKSDDQKRELAASALSAEAQELGIDY